MNYPRVASGYSKALLDLAIEGNALDQVRADAQLCAASLGASEELAVLMKSPVVKGDQKKNVLNALFGAKVSPLFSKFLDLLIKNGREDKLAAICLKFEEDVLSYKGIVKAKVSTAVALSDAHKESLVKRLAEQLGKEIILEEVVDSSLLGGAKIEVSGYMLDTTIAGKLRSMKHQLVDTSYQSKL